MAGMCGGATPAQEATEEIQVLCDKIRADLETRSAKTFSEFTAKQFSSQVVAGTNYFVKVHTGNSVYVHVRIFVPLPHTGEKPSLHSYLLDKTLDDAIGHFDASS